MSDAAVPADNCSIEAPRRRRSVARMKNHHICLAATALAMLFLLFMSKRTIYVPPEDKVLKNHTSHSSISPGSPSQPIVSVGETPRAPPLASPTAHQKATTIPQSDSSHSTTTLPNRPSQTTSGLEVSTQPKPASSTKPVSIPSEPSRPPIIPSSKTVIPPSSFSSPNELGGHNMTRAEVTFVETWCNLNNGKVQWYPTGSNAWQQRAPYVIIPGEKHTGTTFLYQALLSHPDFVMAANREELQFFLPNNFNRYLSGRSASDSSSPSKRTTNVFVARQRMYAQDYTTKKLTTSPSSNKISVDATSGYLFYTSREVPQHVLCVTPWSQLIIVLRDPVDRLYSQWAHGRQYLRLKQSFEDWIAPELLLMQSVGLISSSDNQNPTQALSVAQEDEAWGKYQSSIGVPSSLGSASHGAIGRSMYAITLRHWITAYKKSGKTIPESIHIIRTEDLETNFQHEYDKALQFLHLSPHDLLSQSSAGLATTKSTSTGSRTVNNIPSDLFAKKIGATKNYQQQPMKAETRQKLKDFFAPYNRRLYKLIEQEFGVSTWSDKHW